MSWEPLSRWLASGALTTAAGVMLLAAATPAAAAAPTTTTLYVSASTGSDSNACTAAAPCATIGHAVAQAAAGDTIMVAPGTYDEQVTITVPLTLEGSSGSIIDASGLTNGIIVRGSGAAGTVIDGLRVEGANQEGILLQGTSDVTVEHNIVTGNDAGMFSRSPTGECAPTGVVPGDCGEGIHLMSVTGSTISGNLVADNAGGILLTDELGPTAHNIIEDNYVVDNAWDCGITLASHSPRAMAGGKPDGATGGVYANQILNNESVDNGLADDAGAGILIAAAGPGGANYDNVVEGNSVSGNGNPGLTMHSHAPNQYLGGNTISGNYFNDDNTEGDATAHVSSTVGVLLWSAVVPIPGTTISGNYFSDLHYGIWTHNAVGSDVSGNSDGSGVAVGAAQG